MLRLRGYKRKRKKMRRKNPETQSVIIEIRAGAGGDEASLFIADLFRMYSRYASIQGWERKIMNSQTTSIGGFKEIIFELKGKNVFDKMRQEAGVHRVQRIPKTEKRGRIHTSTVTVAVLSKPRVEEIKMNPSEIEIESFCASGPGGQYTNRRETAIRIIHKPTKITVSCQSERSQAKNKENALQILEARLLEKERSKKLEAQAGERRIQIKRAKRSEKIRTYNFPQNRLTDHRIKKSFHNLDKIMQGNLGPIIKKLKAKL